MKPKVDLKDSVVAVNPDEIIPVDGVFLAETPLEAARRTVNGLLAVGVKHEEALASVVNTCPFEGFLQMACEVVPDEWTRERILSGDVVRAVKDKVGFGQACFNAFCSVSGEGLSEAARSIKGLRAIRVPISNAMFYNTKNMDLAEVFELPGVLKLSPLATLNGLYGAQKHFKQKVQFGKACLEHGINPAGIGLAAKEPKKAKNLIKAFGVDTWLIDHIDYDGLTLDCTKEPSFLVPMPSVPWNVLFVKNEDAELPAVDVDWLVETEGNLYVERVENVSLHSLERVGGTLCLTKSMNIYAPKAEVEAWINAEDSSGISFPSVKVLEGLDVRGSRNVTMDALVEITEDLFAGDSSDLSLLSLKKVGSSADLDGVKIRVPRLEEVGGEPYVDGR